MYRYLLIGLLLLAPTFAWGQAQQTCNAVAFVTPTTATDTQIVAPVAGKKVTVCSFEASSNASTNFYLESSTAASCGGTLAAITNTFYTQQFWLKPANTFYPGLNTGVGKGLCVNTSASGALSITVYYAQTP